MNVRKVAQSMIRKTGYLLTVDDLVQEGELAILLAKRAGRIPEDPLHAEKYLYTRVRGAMMDAARQMHGHFDGSYSMMTGDLADHDAPSNTPSAERTLQARNAVQHLLRKSPRKHAQCFAIIAQGTADNDAGAAVGLSYIRVSQIKKAARQTLRGHWP